MTYHRGCGHQSRAGGPRCARENGQVLDLQRLPLHQPIRVVGYSEPFQLLPVPCHAVVLQWVCEQRHSEYYILHPAPGDAHDQDRSVTDFGCPSHVWVSCPSPVSAPPDQVHGPEAVGAVWKFLHGPDVSGRDCHPLWCLQGDCMLQSAGHGNAGIASRTSNGTMLPQIRHWVESGECKSNAGASWTPYLSSSQAMWFYTINMSVFMSLSYMVFPGISG